MTTDTTAPAAVGEAEVLALVDELFATADPSDEAGFLGRKFDLGLARVHFPVGFGGLGASPRLQALVDQTIAERGGPALRWTAGPGMCAPTIVTHGTDEQARRWFRPLFAGEEVWCQLFSEPGAGSDVAALATRAVRDGDHWVVNGQKVWTSAAHHASWGLLLARTNPDVPKHRGITAFVVDMHQPGVDVRPLRQMTGDSEFNEVYFTDAIVPDDQRIGGEGEGWRVATTTLMNERVAIGGRQPVRGEGPIAAAVQLWQQRQPDSAVLRDELVSCWVAAEVHRLTSMRSARMRTLGTPGPEGSIGKLYSAMLSQRVANLVSAILGADAMLHPGYDGDGRARDAASAAVLYAASASIGGGTSEIMRNIIGERTLGLPGDVRVDRELPWKNTLRS